MSDKPIPDWAKPVCPECGAWRGMWCSYECSIGGRKRAAEGGAIVSATVENGTITGITITNDRPFPGPKE